MNNYENIARIKELTSLLNKYRDKYYNYSESLVSDAEYDKLFDELRELEKWVASGRSPYDNGDYIYSENGCPMDFVSAMRFQDEMYEWWMSLSEEEREQELRELRGDYDTVSDSIIINTEWSDPVMDPDAELPFS